MRTVNIGLAGFGTVGGAVYRNLLGKAKLLQGQYGIRPAVAAIAAKNLGSATRAKRGAPGSLLVSGLDALVSHPKVDVVVELMGGCGAARQLILAALRAGKPVVTANKALLAEHGREIFRESSRRGVPVFFEASVGGGIPIIQSLREGLVANRFDLIYGIVNGTCNYILTKMGQEGAGFDATLREAQALGYAEADPTLDIDGWDAAHKGALLASLAAGGCVDFRRIHVEGIRHVSLEDIQYARQMGYVIKLLVIVRARGPGKVEVRVHPTLLPSSNRLASIHGVTNAVMVRGDVVGDVEFSGPGAGGNATSSAVISDIMAAARHLQLTRDRPKGGDPVMAPSSIRPDLLEVIPMDSVVSRYYLRLSVTDRPGVLARIASILGRARIGISSVFQPEGRGGQAVPLILTIHDAPNGEMRRALERIGRLACVKARPVLLRMETFAS